MKKNQDNESQPEKLQLNFSRVKEIIDILQSIFTIAAIIAAAWWFFFQAEALPRVGISHSVNYYKINDDWTWVYVSITLENLGKRPVNFSSEKVWLQKVLPIDKSIKDRIEQNVSLISEKGRLGWPLIGEPYQKEIDIDIYPGESDTLNYEFVIPSYIKTIRLYSFYQRQGSNKGWRLASLYDLKD